ncbi:MAG: hypothetical protein JW817_07985 [Clostridiales bacterium]|nr:hypothetical protein [Clostridiales bacterium]
MGKQTTAGIRTYITMMITSRKISTASTINRLILFCQRLPLIGRLVPDSFYGISEGKTAFLILGNLFRLNKRLLIKAMYIGFMVIWAYWIRDMAGMGFSVFPVESIMTLFFFMSFIAAPLSLSKSMNLDVGVDLMIIDKLRADADVYVPARIFERKIIDFFATMPFALLLAIDKSYSVPEALAILPLMTAAKLVGEALFLSCFSFFRRFSKKTYKTVSYCFLGIAIAVLILPFFVIVSGNQFPFKRVVFHPVFVVGTLFLAAFSVVYIRRYRLYRTLAWGTVVNFNLAMEKVKPRQKNQQFGDSAKWSKDLKDEDIRTTRFSNLTGYAFFNRVFFSRHRKFFGKKILIRVCLLAGIIIGLVIALLLIKKDLGEEFPIRFLPVCFFIGYMVSLGRSATAAMFANCDVAMLSYPFYRSPSVVIRNFYLRLKTILLYNAPSFALLLIFAVIFDLLAPLIQSILGARVQWTLIPLYVVTLVMMWIFFSFHDLFIYYIIQPYTADMSTKSKLFSFIQMGVYYISYMNMQLTHVNINIYMLIVIAATLVYFVVGLLAINKFCPKTFRLK